MIKSGLECCNCHILGNNWIGLGEHQTIIFHFSFQLFVTLCPRRSVSDWSTESVACHVTGQTVYRSDQGHTNEDSVGRTARLARQLAAGFPLRCGVWPCGIYPRRFSRISLLRCGLQPLQGLDGIRASGAKLHTAL